MRNKAEADGFPLTSAFLNLASDKLRYVNYYQLKNMILRP